MSDVVFPDESNIIDVKGPLTQINIGEYSGRMCIVVDYNWVCEQLLRRCKRTAHGLITDASLIDACMELTRLVEDVDG